METGKSDLRNLTSSFLIVWTGQCVLVARFPLNMNANHVLRLLVGGSKKPDIREEKRFSCSVLGCKAQRSPGEVEATKPLTIVMHQPIFLNDS